MSKKQEKTVKAVKAAKTSKAPVGSTLYVRGITDANKAFLVKNAKAKGHRTLGAYLNAIVKDLRVVQRLRKKEEAARTGGRSAGKVAGRAVA